MKVLADYHTHSRYSRWYHATGTVEQMAQSAAQKGLKELAITDHGPKHVAFGIRPKNFKKAKQDCLNATQKTGVKVYFGIESNIIGQDGEIDLSKEQIDMLDILLMGYHKGTKCNFIKYFNIKRRNSPEQIEKNTIAYIIAINRFNIAIITHLNEYIRVDTARVAQACAAKNTIIEINAKHLKLTDDDVQVLLQSGVNFVVSSDAHSTKRVADVQKCLNFIAAHNIPLERVKNIDGLLDFLQPKGKIISRKK